MRCTSCGSVLVKERQYTSELDYYLFYVCDTAGCAQEGVGVGLAEDDGPDEVYPATPGSPRVSLMDAGRPVRR